MCVVWFAGSQLGALDDVGADCSACSFKPRTHPGTGTASHHHHHHLFTHTQLAGQRCFGLLLRSSKPSIHIHARYPAAASIHKLQNGVQGRQPRCKQSFSAPNVYTTDRS